MINVYYRFKKTERTKEKVGFSCKTYFFNKLVGSYATADEAKKEHPPFEDEAMYPDGAYIITGQELPEKEEVVKQPKKEEPKKKKY